MKDCDREVYEALAKTLKGVVGAFYVQLLDIEQEFGDSLCCWHRTYDGEDLLKLIIKNIEEKLREQ